MGRLYHGNRTRIAQVEAEAAMNACMAKLEERITEVEKRLNMPPAA